MKNDMTWYTDGENKGEEMEMTNQLSPIEMIKEEFCGRYGLDPEQVNVEINIHDVKKVVAEEIVKDYGNKYDFIDNYDIGGHCAHADNKNFKLWTHYREEDQPARKFKVEVTYNE